MASLRPARGRPLDNDEARLRVTGVGLFTLAQADALLTAADHPLTTSLRLVRPGRRHRLGVGAASCELRVTKLCAVAPPPSTPTAFAA